MRMYMKITLCFIVMLSIILPNQTIKTQAATVKPKTAWVNITDGTLNVRTGPGTEHSIIGALTNNTQVTVYSQTKNGWSEIRYKNQKAYVFTKYLRLYTYLMDKTKVYTYDVVGELHKYSYKGKYKKWDEWTYETKNGLSSLLLYEDNKGLEKSWPHSEIRQSLLYPIKLGKSWYSGYYGEGFCKIISINETVTTPAGTFKNVIVVNNKPDQIISYYAPNFGLIKYTYKGKPYSTLVSLKEKTKK